MPHAGDDAIEAVVVDFSRQWLRIAVPPSAAESLTTFVGPWRVDLYANTTAHQRCVAAVNTVASGMVCGMGCGIASGVGWGGEWVGWCLGVGM